MSATTFTRPTAFGFTIRAGSKRLYIRHDATGYVCPLRDAIDRHLTTQELVARTRACEIAFGRTGDARYRAAAALARHHHAR